LSPFIYGAFIFTVLLLALTAYSLMGGLPLLILKHDVALDARFVRAFFNAYYRVAFWLSVGAFLSYALWGRPLFAAGAAGIGATTALLRRYLLAIMRQLGEQIEPSDAAAIGSFRRVHGAALLANLLLLVVLVAGVLKLSIEFS
jgi:hypothetical protein